jgi:hypothetical protein
MWRKGMSRYQRWLPYLVYGLLSLAILGPLLLCGYIFTLDMPFAPSDDLPSMFNGLHESLLVPGGAPFYFLMHQVGKVVPLWLLQKVLAFLLLFLAGLGGHRLLSSKGAGAYFGGLLYMINPFTYVRFITGQWGVLAAYALTPFAIKVFIELLQNGGRRDMVKVALLSTLVGMVMVQGYFVLFLAFFIIFLVKVIREREQPATIGKVSKSVGISAALFCGLNLYWLVPVWSGAASFISQLGWADLLFFAPKPTSNLGVAFDTASMYGFWRGGYIYASNLLPFWWLLFIFILFLAIYGFLSSHKIFRTDADHQDKSNSRWVVLSFGIIGMASFLLALGAASEISRRPFEWLWEHVPFLSGFRDSQKFVALVCLSYAYLGGLGVNELIHGLRRQRKRLSMLAMTAVVALALLTPPVYSFTMFGFHGQLRVTDYPQEWYEVNKHLNQDKDDFNVLFLPWHQYMDYSWLANSDKRMTNRARQFFNKPVIQGDNIEVTGIYSQSTNPISKYIEFLLQKGNEVNNLGELLAPLNVKYIILAHEADYETYEFLYRQKDLTIELNRQGITLFRNEHTTSRAYGVDSLVYVKDLDEYLELSKTQDVMEHLYIIGSGLSDDGITQMEKLSFVEKNPVRYLIGGTSHKYTVFTVPQNVSTRYWEYDGQQPAARNLGFMPAFKSEESGGQIVYRRFYRVYLPSYVISAIALALILWLYFRRRPKCEPASKSPVVS